MHRSRFKPNPRVRLLRTTPDDIDIWLVDGEMIRDFIYDDFCFGGNNGRYPRFIPRNEIWIEKVLSVRDREATIVHELEERARMLFLQESYNKAHHKARHVERVFRRTFPRRAAL